MTYEVVVQPTGDRAEAETWEAAQVAARTLSREARQNGARPTVIYFIDGVLTTEGAVRTSEEVHDMSVHVRTSTGLITSYREAWKNKQGEPVFTWRVDAGEAPHDFGTEADADAWVEHVWRGSSQKERDEAAWTVEVAP